MEKILYRGALGGSLISYLVSCFLPCFSTTQESTIGYYCLLGGWIFIISDFWMFMIWASNILYLCSLIMIVKNNSKCVCFSASSCILSISMIFHRYITYDIIVPITHFRMGFYLWCLSHWLTFLVCLLKVKKTQIRAQIRGRQIRGRFSDPSRT